MDVRGLALTLVIVAAGLTGCLASQPAPGAPTLVAGTWTVLGPEQGEPVARLELATRSEPHSDGEVRPAPVLVLTFLEGEARGGWVVHHLAPEGTHGMRTDGGFVASGPLGDTRFPADLVVFQPNVTTGHWLDWPLIVPGWWGWDVEPTRTVTARSVGSQPLPLSYRTLGPAEGCTRVSVATADRSLAVLGLCGGVVPAWIEVPGRGRFTVRAEEVTDQALHPRPAVEELEPPVVEGVPGQGRHLPFPLEAARAAMERHPVSQAYLTDHPEAAAVSGRMVPVTCLDERALLACRATTAPGQPNGWAWRLNWTDQAGDGLHVQVVRPTDRAGPAVVTTVDGATVEPGAWPPQGVTADTALDRQRSLQTDGFELRTVSFELRPPEPTWVFGARRAPDGGGATAAWATFDLVVSARTGLVERGWITPAEGRGQGGPQTEAPTSQDPIEGGQHR